MCPLVVLGLVGLCKEPTGFLFLVRTPSALVLHDTVRCLRERLMLVLHQPDFTPIWLSPTIAPFLRAALGGGRGRCWTRSFPCPPVLCTTQGAMPLPGSLVLQGPRTRTACPTFRIRSGGHCFHRSPQTPEAGWLRWRGAVNAEGTPTKKVAPLCSTGNITHWLRSHCRKMSRYNRRKIKSKRKEKQYKLAWMGGRNGTSWNTTKPLEGFQ